MNCITIVPIGDVSQSVLKKLSSALIHELGVSCYVGKGIDVPASAFNPARRQFSGEVLLEILADYPSECLILGVTEVDLYAGDLNFIFGIAQISGKACVISLHRLKPEFYGEPPNEELLMERAIKEALHELGHVLGMHHCRNKLCVMSFSNSIYEVDFKSQKFCPKHMKILKRILM